ncbi:unnamed protein product [Chilo suppressalis]|uniref:WD repeat-containing protein 89 n=1 Tax=Chilo suppressalis TaxID=168631 RepID=A0ABN8B2G3_CHISP|nr:unnamed protein product [Chilo suppressalis]
MDDIIDKEELDKDTDEPTIIEQLFQRNYNLLTQTAVTLKKSYVNKLDGTSSLKIAVGVADNNSVEVFDLKKTSLSLICRLSGHEKSLTEVVFSQNDDQLLYTTGHDGLIKLWDLRAGGSCAQEYKDDDDEQIVKPFECVDVSCNGRVLCAGSQLVQDDAYLVFWDQRKPKPLGGYWNSHTDDITQIKFHKEKTEIITTGAMDGLLNVFNILEQTEDEALTFSLNVENSIEKISWLDATQVACTTQSNDFQIWNSETGDMIRSFSRDKVAKSIKRSKGDDCYLVDAYTSVDDTPVLLAGSHGENGDVLRSVTVAGKKLQPCSNFTQNKQTVRCCWYNKERDMLVTAGESGLVSVWSATDGTGPETAVNSKITGAIKNLRVNRHKPY